MECYLTNKLYMKFSFSHEFWGNVDITNMFILFPLTVVTSRGTDGAHFLGVPISQTTLGCIYESTVYEHQFFAPNLNSKNSIYVYRKGVAKETVADEACHLCE